MSISSVSGGLSSMDKIIRYYVLIATCVLCTIKSYAQQSECQRYFDGFTLQENYNRNRPPSNNVTIQMHHMLTKIDEVRH